MNAETESKEIDLKKILADRLHRDRISISKDAIKKIENKLNFVNSTEAIRFGNKVTYIHFSGKSVNRTDNSN
jgi:tetrahydromethanopterin S-methyltransferase subunit G